MRSCEAPPVRKVAPGYERRLGIVKEGSPAERAPVPSLEPRELGDVLALELGELTDRSPERHDGSDGHVTGNAEELLDLRLLGHGQRGDGAAEALVASREQDVPREGVDRGAADDADPV